MKLTITDCLAVFSDNFILCRPSIGEGAIDLQSAGSNASLYRISVPDLIKRLQEFAITQPTPLFDACIAPTDAIRFQKWSQVFPRNVVGSMSLIWRINKGNKTVSYTPSHRNGRRGLTSNPGFFSGLQFYDAATSGTPPPCPAGVGVGSLNQDERACKRLSC